MSKYSISVFWSDEDEGFIAVCPEFPGLSAFGKTPEEATSEARIAQQLFIDTYNDEGLPLPEPQKAESFSGQTRVRFSKTLHRQAAQLAKREGISLNSLIEDALSARVTGTQFGQHLINEMRTVLAAYNLENRVAQAWPRSTIKEQTVTTKTEQTVFVPELKFEKRGN